MPSFPWFQEEWVPEAVRAAFQRVPYEQLVLQENGAPVIQSTAPGMMARMLTGLRVEPGMRVLEIGTGSGYNAALLQELVGTTGSVVTVEVDLAVAARARLRLAESGYGNVEVVVADGWLGVAASAPYDRILAACKPPALPPAWLAQLRTGGWMAVPLDLRGIPYTTVVIYFQKKCATRLDGGGVHPSGFVGMASTPEAIQNEPWKRADLVVWGREELRCPALWLHFPQSLPDRQEQLSLLGVLLQKPRRERLSQPCSDPLAFWIDTVVRGAPENLLVQMTDNSSDLPGSGFGLFAEGGVAYLEVLAYREEPGCSDFCCFGESKAAREQLLELYSSWLQRGQPDLSTLRVEATRDDTGDWSMRFIRSSTLPISSSVR